MVRSLIQKLKNRGFSATESGDWDEVKFGTIGMSFVGSTASQVESEKYKVRELLIGDFQVLFHKEEMIKFEELSEPYVSFLDD